MLKTLWATIKAWFVKEETIVKTDWEKVHAEADALLAKYKK